MAEMYGVIHVELTVSVSSAWEAMHAELHRIMGGPPCAAMLAQMAEQGTIIQGRRTIRRVPTADIDKRREGRIDNVDHEHKVWTGGTIGEVVDSMNHDLGAADDQAYHVTE